LKCVILFHFAKIQYFAIFSTNFFCHVQSVPIDGFYYTYGKYGTYIDAAIMPRTRYNSTWANSSLPDPALDWHDEFIVNALTPAQAISVAVYYSGDIYYHGVYLNALVTVEKLP
jgi:hypothetical protein